MLAGRQQVDAKNLLQVLRQLPPDAVSHLLEHLGSNGLKSLKLASKELAGLVRSCGSAVNVVRQRAELPAPAELEKQVKVLEAYTFATNLTFIVHDDMDVTAVLVGSAALNCPGGQGTHKECGVHDRMETRRAPCWTPAKGHLVHTCGHIAYNSFCN